MDAARAAGRGDPAWLQGLREEAWRRYMETPMPSTRSEEWRYTDIGALLELNGLARAPGERWEAGPPENGAGGIPAVTADGDALLGAGGELTSLRAAAREELRGAREHLESGGQAGANGKFSVLNAALWTEGVYARIPAGANVETPVRIHRRLARAGTVCFHRIVVVAEAGSRCVLVDEIESSDFDDAAFLHSEVEIRAAEGASVQYACIQKLGRGCVSLANQKTSATRDATLDTLNVALGASVARVDLGVKLLGPGARSNMLGLYFADGDQHLDFNTSQDHVAPRAHSDLLYKGALAGRSRGIFRGIIRVRKGAQRTDAYQTNRNLLLGDEAKSVSLPNLEIGADDVRCSHGATVGQLDEDALFYLMSRGMSREEARRLVVIGFLGEVLGRVKLASVEEDVLRAIRAKLRASARKGSGAG